MPPETLSSGAKDRDDVKTTLKGHRLSSADTMIGHHLLSRLSHESSH